jgi:hypothetical protein
LLLRDLTTININKRGNIHQAKKFWHVHVNAVAMKIQKTHRLDTYVAVKNINTESIPMEMQEVIFCIVKIQILPSAHAILAVLTA